MLEFLKAHKKNLYIALGAFLVFGTGYQLYNAIVPKPPVAKAIPLVRTITIGEAKLANNSIYPGAVHGRYESNLAFQVGGKINARLVNLGDKIRCKLVKY